MQLKDLFLNRWLFRTDQTVETLGSDYVAANVTPPPSNAIASGNSVIDINSNAQYLNGATILPGSIPPATLDVSNWGWTQTCAFSKVDLDTVSWGAGTFTSANGASYAISGGSTGNMAAKTYVYLDVTSSTTTYLTTTNINTPVGVGKVLIAVCENGAVDATYMLVQATQIVGDNILANTVNASKITAGSITATQLSTSILYAGTITLDTNGQIKGGQTGYDNGSGFFLGMSGGIYKFSVGNSAGNKITWDGTTLSIGGTITGYIPTGGGAADVNAGITKIQGGQIVTGTITATQIGANQVTADKLTAGVFQVGGTSEPTAILVAAGSISANSRISFNTTSGPRIWGDSSNYLGLNATGGNMYFYCNSNQALGLFDGAQAVIGNTSSYRGLLVYGPFNVGLPGGTAQDARINGGYLYFSNSGGGESIYGGSANILQYNAVTSHYVNVNGNLRMSTSNTGTTFWGSNGIYISQVNYIDVKDWRLTLTADKTAIIPTSQGFRALYCTESPEVWFMDFCESKDKLDPLFLEVTTAPYHYIKCEDGEYQVWGKRKGKEDKRFEKKTGLEFIANERFLNMSKPN